MPLMYKESVGQGIVALWKIEEGSEELLNGLHLTSEDLDRVKKFRLESRRQEFLATRMMIHEVLKIDPEICYLPSGKPVLANSSYHLSISHTQGYAAVVLSCDDKTGIDIEKPRERVLKVSSRFINKNEENFIDDHKRLEYYTLIWCLKEAMYKIYDQKAIMFNQHFEALPFRYEKDGFIKGAYNFDYKECLIYRYKIFSDFFLVYRC